jgi:Lon protease-like protein
MNVDAEAAFELPLFPLQSVLFPGGLLGLKVFEARYLDLIGSCLRERSSFGVVALKKGSELKANGAVALESVGCSAELIEVDSERPGTKQADGLWVAQVHWLPDDETVLPTQALLGSAKGLANAIATLKQQGSVPFLEPYEFDSAGWLANRWCEILPISLAAKQKLMELPDPLVRLQLVDEFLRSKGVVE